MAALAKNVVALNNIWTWFNDPRCVYDSAEDILYYAGINLAGQISIYSWDFTRRIHLQGSPRNTVLQVDDHDNPALLLLSSGKILAAYSQHNGDSYCARTTNAHDIRTWDAEVTVNTAEDHSYCNLYQMGDDAETVFWFYRNGGGHSKYYYRTSTDEGDTWSAGTQFMEVDGPYFKGIQNGANRVDFCLCDHPNDVVGNAIYAGYMLVASNGAVTFHKSDGTEVTGAPFTADEFTLVYDGSTTEGWMWDIAIIGGNPVITYATFESSNEVHRYHQARWTGSAWASNEVTTGGTTATADYLYADEVNYSGGIALDPNDINTVYLSREYGAGNFRLEKWTHTGTFGSGSWAKAADISGNTGTVNARPYCPRGLSPTRVLWWSGSYTSFTIYNTNLRMDPAPDWRAAKPATPVWTAGYAPSGVQAYYLLHEGSGGTVADLANARDGSITGSPTWNAGDGGDFGAFLSGFSTSDYVNIDALAAALNVTGYPIWCYVLYKSTSAGTAAQRLFGFGHGTDANPRFSVFTNSGTATTCVGQWQDTAGSSSLATASVAASNDGEFHVLQVRKGAAADLRLRFDGDGVNTNTTLTSTVAFNRGAIGAIRRSTGVTDPFDGEIHAIIFGWGAEPDLRWLTLDLLQGQFAGTFDPDVAPASSGATRLRIGIGIGL